MELRDVDRTVMRDGNRALNGRQLYALIGRLERRFVKAGIRTGDHVPCIVSPSIESVAAIYALGMIGAAYVPVSPRAPRARQAYIIDDVQARAVITDQPYLLVGADVRYILLQRDDADETDGCNTADGSGGASDDGAVLHAMRCDEALAQLAEEVRQRSVEVRSWECPMPVDGQDAVSGSKTVGETVLLSVARYPACAQESAEPIPAGFISDISEPGSIDRAYGTDPVDPMGRPHSLDERW